MRHQSETHRCYLWTVSTDSEMMELRSWSGVGSTPKYDWSDTVQFLERLLLHYGIYRRYPLKPWPAFKNAWRIAFR